jgi:hypothetical protein
VAAVRLLKLAVNQKSLRTEDNKVNEKFSFNHRSLLPSFPSVKVERCPLTVILQSSLPGRLGPHIEPILSLSRKIWSFVKRLAILGNFL